MYFPYIRGKQFDLIALKETAIDIAKYYQTEIGNEKPVYHISPEYLEFRYDDPLI